MKLDRAISASSRPRRISRTRVSFVGVTVAMATLFCGCRLDMHIQPKYLPDKPTNFFSDGRSERPQVPGTVAHGHLYTDELRYEGTMNGEPANEFPFPITAADLERGQQRFNIYCSPCHGYDGKGRGMIVLRGFQQPPSYDTDRLRTAPVGHFFQVITNGFGNMYSYASRVSPDDRWRIAAYIRALQLADHATSADVPPNEHALLGMPDESPNQQSAQSKPRSTPSLPGK